MAKKNQFVVLVESLTGGVFSVSRKGKKYMTKKEADMTLGLIPKLPIKSKRVKKVSCFDKMFNR